MSLFGFWRQKSSARQKDSARQKGSASAARERLQILLAHERAACGGSDLLSKLREEIMAVVARHVAVEHDKVQIKMDRGDSVSMLEIDIEIPNAAGVLPVPA
jgi:cell division topological specificity factor